MPGAYFVSEGRVLQHCVHCIVAQGQVHALVQGAVLHAYEGAVGLVLCGDPFRAAIRYAGIVHYREGEGFDVGLIAVAQGNEERIGRCRGQGRGNGTFGCGSVHSLALYQVAVCGRYGNGFGGDGGLGGAVIVAEAEAIDALLVGRISVGRGDAAAVNAGYQHISSCGVVVLLLD